MVDAATLTGEPSTKPISNTKKVIKWPLLAALFLLLITGITWTLLNQNKKIDKLTVTQSTQINKLVETKNELQRQNLTLTVATDENNEKLKEAREQVEKLSNDVKAYDKKTKKLKEQAEGAAEGEPITFPIVTGGTPIEPSQYFTGVGKVVTTDGKEVE